MKRIALLLTAGLLMFGWTANAQPRHEKAQPSPEEVAVKVLSYESTRIGENINLDFLINYDRVLLNPNEEFTITPYIENEGEILYLRPVVFIGERCHKQKERHNVLYGESPSDKLPYETIVMNKKEMRERNRELRKNNNAWTVNSDNTVRYMASFPYAAWMDGAKLKLHHVISGCKGDAYTYKSVIGTIYNPLPPQVSFIVPEVETVKARSESMTARVIFEVNKTNIRSDLFNNQAELDRIYKFVDNIANNEDIKITKVHMTGYASPEGNYKHNTDLSLGRVNALRNLLQQRYTKVDKGLYQVNNVPEDWDSVRRWVAASSIQHRQAVLDIIDGTAEPDARDAKIRNLDRNATYNMLLKEVYPGIRRTEFTIGYTVMPFTVEKGKEVIKTNPQYLSLNEFYQIAQSYPINSDEYRSVFDMAVRYFPNDPVALNNMAAMALQNGDLAMARLYLDRIGDFEGAQNNLGILNALEGNYEAAESHFRRAMRSGSKDAEYNLKNIHSLKF